MPRTAQTGNTGGLLGADDRALRYTIEEYFQKRPALHKDVSVSNPNAAAVAILFAANRNWELASLTGSTTALATFADRGGVTLTTGGTANDKMVVRPHLDAGATAGSTVKWNTNDEIYMRSVIYTAASVADIVVFAGFKLTRTDVVATDDNQAFFRFESGVASGFLQAIVSNAGTDVTTTLSDVGAVAASTKYDLEITVDEIRVPKFFVNGKAVFEGTALAADIDLLPFVGVMTKTSAAKAITLPYVKVSKLLNP
jgi:hypothetical protein